MGRACIDDRQLRKCVFKDFFRESLIEHIKPVKTQRLREARGQENETAKCRIVGWCAEETQDKQGTVFLSRWSSATTHTVTLTATNVLDGDKCPDFPKRGLSDH